MKKELLAGNWLGDDHINLAQELLNEEYPNLHGLQSPLLCQNDSFGPIGGDSIQIHFVNNNHWVTSACFNEEVTIYDSKYNGELPPSLTHQLAIIYKQFADNDDDETFLNLNVPNVQQQTGVDDCGLFAIAFAVHAARGDCVGELDFDQAKMRSHVIKCFSQKKMLPFPIIESKYCTSIKRHMFFPGRQIELFCECRMPETYDNMIQCDQCCTWFHIKSMSLQCIPNEWYCTNCRRGLAA